MRRMFDASTPPTSPPPWEVAAGYIGGNTPHVWTDQEWAAQKARYRLPIFTRSTGGDPNIDAAAAVRWLRAHGVPPGCCVGLDFETRIDPGYLRTFDWIVGQAGYLTMVYGTRRTVLQNPKPSGGYWIAEWSGTPHLYPGSAATQWSGSGPFGGEYDPNLVADSAPLWDTQKETLMPLTDADAPVIRKALGLKDGEQVATDADIRVVLRGGDATHPDNLKQVRVDISELRADLATDLAAILGKVGQPDPVALAEALAPLVAGQLEITGIATEPGGIVTVTFGPAQPSV